MPASRSSIAPNTLGESTRGRHSHSTFPLGATSATVSQSDRNAYSAIGGNGLPRSATPGASSPMPGRTDVRRAGDFEIMPSYLR